MKKHIISALIGLLAPATLSAQSQSRFQPMERPFTMAISFGPGFNPGASSIPEPFGKRPQVAPEFDFRIGYPLRHHWSAFLDLGLSFYPMKADNMAEAIGTALANAILPGFGSVHPSASAGIFRLSQFGCFLLIPRAGLGWMHVKKGTGYPFKADSTRVTIARNISSPTINLGISAGYRTSRLCSLILDAGWSCPLRRSTATVTTVSGASTETVRYTSRAWGNDFTVSVGLQFNVELD